MDPGSDATQDLSFWTTTSGTVTSDSGQAYTGPRSIKLDTTGANVTAFATRGTVVADTGSRVSFRFRFDVIPTATTAIINFNQVDLVTTSFGVTLTTAAKLNLNMPGATGSTGTTVLSVNTWYRISVSYYITNATTYQAKLYIDGVLEGTGNTGTLSVISTNAIQIRHATTWGASKNAWYDDIYVDDGASSSSQPDTGDIRVTAKRPLSNGTTNGWTTQIGSGGSGYGTGHAPQVNEQPLSQTNGWSLNFGNSTVEEYNVENAATGDVNISSGVTIVDVGGWVFAKTTAAETAQIIVNGSNSNISLDTTAKWFGAYTGSATYPAGTGSDIGAITAASSVLTDSLYECGIVVAYTNNAASTAVPRMLLLGVGM